MRILRMAAVAAALVGASAAPAAFGQAKFPERTITIVVPFGPGTVDTVSRLVAEAFKNRLGQSAVVENKPGAFGNIGWIYTARQPADGHTIAMMSNSVVVNPHLYKMEIDVLKDLTPIARAAEFYYVLLVNKSVPANSVKEFFDYAKNQKEPMHFGVASMSGQVGLAELVDATGVKFQPVNYKGGGEMTRAVIAGQVPVMFTIVTEAVSHKDTLKLLGVSGRRPVAQLPNVQPISDAYPSYQQVGWIGYGAPGGTPRRVIEILNKTIMDAVNSEPMKSQLAKMGLDPAAVHDADSFAKYLAEDYQRYGRIVKTYNLKAE